MSWCGIGFAKEVYVMHAFGSVDNLGDEIVGDIRCNFGRVPVREVKDLRFNCLFN